MFLSDLHLSRCNNSLRLAQVAKPPVPCVSIEPPRTEHLGDRVGHRGNGWAEILPSFLCNAKVVVDHGSRNNNITDSTLITPPRSDPDQNSDPRSKKVENS